MLVKAVVVVKEVNISEYPQVKEENNFHLNAINHQARKVINNQHILRMSHKCKFGFLITNPLLSKFLSFCTITQFLAI